ncbi:MAG TPA: tetratricopeptide repeat protein, partial [Candidatus Angelobacter sp.]|nr:tetratricopeptide repeat protein [Candidatus Angelobacter sp.]
MLDTPQDKVFDRLSTFSTHPVRVEFVSRLGLLSPSIVEQLDEAVRVLLRTDLKKAESLAEAAMAIAEKLGDKTSLAYASRAKANAFWFLGKNLQASEMNEKAIAFFEEAGKTVEAGRTLSTSIQPLILLGEYDRALGAAERARKIFVAVDDTVRLARLDINFGNIFHRQDRFSEALDCYQRAYSQLAPDKDAEGIIAALHNVAVCLIALNENE